MGGCDDGFGGRFASFLNWRGGNRHDLLAAVFLPCLVDRLFLEVARVNHELVAYRFGLAFGDGPIAGDGATRTDTQLSVHTPWQWVAGVLGVVKNGNVSLVTATLKFDTDIHP